MQKQNNIDISSTKYLLDLQSINPILLDSKRITLSDAIKQFIIYNKYVLQKYIGCVLKKRIDDAEIFVTYIISYMIEKGYKCNNEQSDKNTFSIAVKSKSVKIINTILCVNPKPNNSSSSANSTLNNAIKTKNLEIIRIVLQNGAEIDISLSEYNSLSRAVLTCDPDIVFEIVAHDGICKPLRGLLSLVVGLQYDPFDTLMSQHSVGIIDTNTIIEILLCSGTKFSPRARYQDDERLKLYYKLFNSSKLDKTNSTEIAELKKIRKELCTTMCELTGTNNKIKIVDRVNNLVMLPKCLNDIIIAYYWIPSSVKFIDWQNIYPIESLQIYTNIDINVTKIDYRYTNNNSYWSEQC